MASKLSPEEQMKQVAMLRDPKFYLESFTKIKGKTPGLAPFILNPAQVDLYNTLRKENRVICLKARQIGFCLSPDTRVLLSTMKWKTLQEIEPGDTIVGVDETASGTGTARKMRHAVVEEKWDVHEEAFEITLDDGRKITATAEHRWFAKKNWVSDPSYYHDPEWLSVSELVIGNQIRQVTRKPYLDTDFEDGWFAGMIDGEGSLAKASRTGAALTISQVDGPVWERVVSYAQREKIDYRIEVDKREAGTGSKFGSKPVNKMVISKTSDIIYLMGKLQPSRLSNRSDWWEGKKLPGNGDSWRTIVDIKSVGMKRMIDLQTSTKTFIAEGLVSHNSTAITGYFYHKTITTPGTTTALIAHKADAATEFLDKVKTFWRSTPESMRPEIHFNSKYEMSFPGLDSKIVVMSGDNVGRGYTIHNALASELAFWPSAEEMMLALENAVPNNGQIVVESTPNGVGNLFHRMWAAKDNGYAKKEYGWWWHYTEEEVELIRKRINDPMRFAQEYELEFLASGRQVFNPHLIRRMQKNILEVGDTIDIGPDETFTVMEQEDGLRIYKPPQAGKIYVCGADVAEGVVGGDYSTAVFYDRETGEEVAFYRGQIPADKFGDKLDEWGRLFNQALMVVEINNHGLTTVTALKNKMYPQLYFRPKQFDKVSSGWSDRLGWRTTKVTRPLMIDDLNDGLREGSLTIHSQETIDEMVTFVFDLGNNMVAMDGFHDDCIFAAAIGFQGFKVMYAGKLDQLDYEQHLPSSTAY